MKKYLLSAILFCSGVVLFASTLNTEIISGPVRVGMQNQLALIHTGNAVPEFVSLPRVDGLRWLSAGSRQSINQINGRISRTVMSIYTFSVDKPGSYTIPAAEVKAGNSKFTTKPVSFTATQPKLATTAPAAGAAQDNVDIDKLLFSKMSITPEQKEFYAGERIPVEIQVYIASNLNCRINWPEIMTGDKATVIFNDYKSRNPENPKFDRPRKGETTIDGRTYEVYLFNTVIRPISIGKLDLSSVTKLLLTVRSNQRKSRSFFDDDDFFGSFFGGGRRVEHTVRSSLPPVTIKQLPPRTGDAKFLGLVGQWKLECSLSKNEAKVGEAVTLTISVSGSGTTEMLTAPTLEFPGFRVYSPEVEKKTASASVKYVLIPTEVGSRNLECKFSTFDPAAGKYEDVSFLKTLNVEKAANVFHAPSGPGVIDGAAEEDVPDVKAPGKRGPTGVLYLKKAPFEEIQVPLWKNTVFRGILAVLIGLAFWIGAELRYLHGRFRSSDPGFQRRNQAKKAKTSLLNRLRTCRPEKVPEMDGEIAAYINNALDLPPGATLSESADVLKEENKELSDALKTLSETSWSRASVSEEFKKNLIRLLAKLVCIALVFGSFQTFAAEKKAIATPEAAMTAYDEGHFTEAEAYYRAQMKKSTPSAKLFYNIGNCLFQQGKYAQALANYEKALRLAPRDSDILENLNLTRRKLSLPQKHALETPADVPPYLRDLLRPDEWMFMIGIGAAILFFGLGLRRMRFRSLWIPMIAAGAVVMLLSFAAMIIQNMSSYDNTAAVVLTRSAPVYALPSAQAVKLADINLQPGEVVHIEETRLDWVRIRAGAAEGWVRKNDIKKLWDL